MSKKVFIIIGTFIFLAILGYTLWWYFFRGDSTPEQQVIEIPEWYHTDKDGDGMSDVREQELGTSPEETDTDGDTIPDRLEIEVYGTDPLNPDTDGDGFPDGLELLQGFNPLEKTAPIQ